MDADNAMLEQLVRWREGLVSGEIFVDPGIHRQETERVFPRAWSYLVHDSQLRQPGDFVTTFIGADPVLVARQRDGSIAAMLNSCRHRGMAVCRADAGHARAFTCPFHGWTYDEAGRLVNVPNLEREKIQGVRMTRMGKRVYGDLIVEKRDPRGRKYFWIGGDHLTSEEVPGSDLEAIEENFVSITPIHLDLTNYAALRALRKWTW